MNDIKIIDTDILIDADREVKKALDFLENISIRHRLSISEITQMELIIGCRNKNELSKLEKFLEQFIILQINELISSKVIDLLKHYHLSHGLLIADALIAATSIMMDIHFSTKNSRDFKFIKELKSIEY